MSPEQRRAMAAVRSGQPVHDALDGRADIYSLGMLLYVALGGPAPESPEVPLVPIHRLNPRVSIGLSDIIDKCLRVDQRDRYQDATSVANDLRRHLADLPLRGVPNRSWAERWRKWRRRHPTSLSRGLVALVLIAAVAAPAATLGIAYRQRRADADAALARGRGELTRRQYAEACDALRQGLALIADLPGFAQQRRELRETLDHATLADRLDQLHALAGTVRFRYGLSPPPADEVPALIRLGQKTWEARDSLLRGLEVANDPESGRRIRADLRGLVLLWAELRVRYASADERDRAIQEAAALLADAAARLGPSPSLERDRRSYERGVRPDEDADRSDQEPRSAWEHYDLGRSYLRSGRPDRAADQFGHGLKLRPQDFWLNFYDGLCAYRLGVFDRAVNTFRVCIALAPDSAECYYNRARASQALDHLHAALEDYDRALELAPRLTDALLNRGLVRFRHGHHEKATADLERALGTTSNPELLGMIRYNLALVYQARDDRAAAARNARIAVGLGNPDARGLIHHLGTP